MPSPCDFYNNLFSQKSKCFGGGKLHFILFTFCHIIHSTELLTLDYRLVCGV